MSYFLNELEISPAALAKKLLKAWDENLEENSLIIWIEPALKIQSRRLLEVRQEILKQKGDDLKLLLPCIGEQACGALAEPEDWCHEEVSWWRAPYYKQIDDLAKLDRKTLPFSYLVFVKGKQSLPEILPKLQQAKSIHRLVSPAHKIGKEQEFFLCGQDGKFRARNVSKKKTYPIKRGFLLPDADLIKNRETYTRLKNQPEPI